MKILLVTFLLAGTLLLLIMSLDLIMGASLLEVFAKAANPFRLMEPTEYAVVFLFIISLGIYLLKTYFFKKKDEDNSSKS
ncbi:hypothetical protein [Neobacillus terrae]|uniref:hypothetical protein n=1 Tax=Neobacillus terrae TaxID=3034837 RepID=UPI00140DFDF9|nr:hypothetical protein [Neobacillus terrae]NHM32051.1 hypothetical protein [Neobacillus terrae]